MSGAYNINVYFDTGSVPSGSYLGVLINTVGNTYYVQWMSLPITSTALFPSYSSEFDAYATTTTVSEGNVISLNTLLAVYPGGSFTWEDGIFSLAGDPPSIPNTIRLRNHSGAEASLGLSQIWYLSDGTPIKSANSILRIGSPTHVDLTATNNVVVFLANSDTTSAGEIIGYIPSPPASIWADVTTDYTPTFYYTADGGFSTTAFDDFERKFPNIDNRGRRVPADTPNSKPAPPHSGSPATPHERK